MAPFSDLLTTTAALVAGGLTCYELWHIFYPKTTRVTYLPTGRSVVLQLRRADRKNPQIEQANREKMDWLMGRKN